MLLSACGGKQAFRTLKVRFSAPVYPGDHLVRAWHDGEGRALFEAHVGEVVINNAYFEYLSP